MSTKPVNRLTVSALLLTLALAAGCRVDTTSTGNGDNVKIATPFGGMSVKTDDNAVATETGLPSYPGATVVKTTTHDGHDSGAADVNMSFAGFQLRVKAVSYRTSDPPAKVLAFYRSGLARFGTVIQCSGDESVGTPTRTPDGLTCSDDDNGKQVHLNQGDTKHGGTELKAGSKQHQHIVSIDPDGTGTKFGLVALDLPGKFPFGDDSGDNSKSDKSQQPE